MKIALKVDAKSNGARKTCRRAVSKLTPFAPLRLMGKSIPSQLDEVAFFHYAFDQYRAIDTGKVVVSLGDFT